VLLSGCEAKGAVDDSIEQEEITPVFAMKRETFFLEIELFVDFFAFCE
jgi:hypothetical protein